MSGERHKCAERGPVWQHVHLGCEHTQVYSLQGASPIVALVDSIDHVLVHQAWLLVTLPLSILLAGTARKGGRSEWGLAPSKR